MPDIELSEAEIAAMFGGEAGPIEIDPDEMAVALALRTLRDRLMEAAKADGVGVNQLAARLHISPSAVSRLLGGEGDMRVSTAVLYARALGRAWDFVLHDDAAARSAGNFRPTLVPAGSPTPTSVTAFPPPTEVRTPHAIAQPTVRVETRVVA
jgi:transcriptional regulator with XRE-family HTH domain